MASLSDDLDRLNLTSSKPMINIGLISSSSLFGLADLIKGLAVFGDEDVVEFIAPAERPLMNGDTANLSRLGQFDENLQGLGLRWKPKEVIELIWNAVR